MLNKMIAGLIIVIASCIYVNDVHAVIGLGAQAGVQVKNGTFPIGGAHVKTTLLPFIQVRPSVDIGRRNLDPSGNILLVNPNIDLIFNLNPAGLGPSAYLGAGAGIQHFRTTINSVTGTNNQANINILGGVYTPVAPMVKLFLEVKAIMSEGNRTGRIMIGVTLSP